MVHRRFWLKLLERAWKERSIGWLAGVRGPIIADTGGLLKALGPHA
jgi:hypothetical protein